MSKLKKQFRLYDIYRYATTGIESKIKGIESYECNKTATTIVVRFQSSTNQFLLIPVNYFSSSEEELKEIVKDINKRLNNCNKPGRRKYVTQ